MNKIKSLQNASDWGEQPPDIVITPADDGWKAAYSNWIEGKNPTADPAWKKGVYLTFYSNQA